MKIQTKIVGGFLMLALLVATVGYFNFTNIKRIQTSFESLDTYHRPAFDALNVMRTETLSVFSSTLKLEFIKGEVEETTATKENLIRERTIISEGKGRFKDSLDSYRILINNYSSSDEADFANIIEKKWNVFVEASDKFVKLKESNSAGADVIEAKRELQDSEQSLVDTLNSVAEYEKRAINEQKETAGAIVRNTLISTVLVLMVSIIAALGSGLLISASIVEPIMQLKEVTEEIARGNMERHLKINSGDEIEALAKSFNDMTWNLKNTKAYLEDRAEKLETSKKELEESVSELKKSGKLTDREQKAIDLKKRISELQEELKKYDGQ